MSVTNLWQSWLEPNEFLNLNFKKQRRIFTVFDVNLYNFNSAPTQVNSIRPFLSPPAILTVDGNIATYAWSSCVYRGYSGTKPEQKACLYKIPFVQQSHHDSKDLPWTLLAHQDSLGDLIRTDDYWNGV